ncbi:ATP-binding protein [Actinacidiphila yeochonensis]|uniref:ATP-binding protein n=1 Tax=Actinacidiphila yeochonensis TaxID=89050 RepID=UPI00068C49DC|nr:ATP-binding protein [Actinacidiphila yeochonensis]
MTLQGLAARIHGFRVDSEESCVPEARHKISALVHGWNVPLSEEQVSELELLSTEVITNAVRHTGAACAVAVRWTGARVRVEVTDASRVHPKARHGSLDTEGGRGLLLVDALAADWGSADAPAGKVVWFEVGPREQPPPWSTPGTWTITTTDHTISEGYLPDWAEDDPTEVNVPLAELPQRLALVNHRTFFEGPTMPVTAPDLWDGPKDEPVFEGSIDCNPHDPDPRKRDPLVNLQLAEGRWVLGLDPQQLAEVAIKLREHADLLDKKIRPALVAARDDWAARHQE